MSLPRKESIGRFQVTFKGPRFDLTLSGDSPEELVRIYQGLSKKFDGLLEAGKVTPQGQGSIEPVVPPAPALQAKTRTLADFVIPKEVKERFVELREKMSNWQVVFFLLHFSPEGLSNRQLRSLSEELGKPISFSWLDTDFHRKKKEGFVISRPSSGTQEVLYFLAEPGKNAARKLIENLGKKIQS